MASPPGDAGRNPCWQRVCQPRGSASGSTYMPGINKQQKGKISSKKRLNIFGSQDGSDPPTYFWTYFALAKHRYAFPNDHCLVQSVRYIRGFSEFKTIVQPSASALLRISYPAWCGLCWCPRIENIACCCWLHVADFPAVWLMVQFCTDKRGY